MIEPAEVQAPSEVVANSDTVLREPFQIDRVHLERLPALLRDPGAALTAYYWNALQTEADADAIADKLFEGALVETPDGPSPCFDRCRSTGGFSVARAHAG